MDLFIDMNDEQQSERDERPGLFQYESAAERVTDAARIFMILKGLQVARSLLTVTIPGVGERFVSTLLKVDPDRGSIWLDELAPRGGHDELLKSGQARTNASLRSVGVFFKLTLKESGEQGGVAWYRFTLPQMVHYLQRRAYYRVPVGFSRIVPVRIEPVTPAPNGENGGAENTSVSPKAYPPQVIHGRLHDISLGGIGLLLPRDLPIKNGSRFERCVIDIEDSDPLVCIVEIRYVMQDFLTNMQRAGARFLSLDARQKRLIEHFSRMLERAALRKHDHGHAHKPEIPV